MRKRKIPLNTPRLDLMPEPVDPLSWNTGIILRLMTRDFYSLYPDEREMLMALVLLIKNKLDPDDYEILFRLLSNHSLILSIPDHLSGVNLSAPTDTPSDTNTSSSGTATAVAPPDAAPVKVPKKRRSKKRETTPDPKIASESQNASQQITASEKLPEAAIPKSSETEYSEPVPLQSEPQSTEGESVIPYDFPLPFSFD